METISEHDGRSGSQKDDRAGTRALKSGRTQGEV